MEPSVKIGIKGEAKTAVNDKNTAIAHGSGGVPVFATPAMIALMENAALSSVEPYLPEGHTTVGIKISSSHVAATPVGMEVTARSELVEIDGKRLVFRVEAYDDADKIGEGTHERFIINSEKFMKRTEAKKTGG
ncbi:MAG: thioesterase [Firmicutes bacterium HGW-Firmicutes-14]|nr:MAG: thioesterase [Firmicutes bacterium HGW-Firmicutes-14]